MKALSDYPELFVLRHGETEWNREGRQQGQLDSPLTTRGMRQAGQQGVVLKEYIGDRVLEAWVSPSGRAQATAKLALAPLGLTGRTDARLLEVHFGQWQGLTQADIAARWPESILPETHFFDWHFNSVGGETYDEFARRVREFLVSLTGPTIVVTHGITSRVLRGLWLGIGRDDMKDIGGGQGIVYHLANGVQRCLEP